MDNIREVMRKQIADGELFSQAENCALDYLRGLSDREVYPTKESIEGLSVFDEDLPEQSVNPVESLAMLHQYGSPATVAQSGGRYFGFVCGGAVPAALAVKWLADVWDQNPALNVLSPVVAQLETVCERWLVDLFHLSSGTAAGFVSGSSTATFCSLAAARDELLKRQGWDISQKGLYGAPPLRVIVGDQVHATVEGALRLLGIGARDIIRTSVDHQGCIDIKYLPPLDERTILVAQAGNVNSGGFDPLSELGERAGRARAWLHVDGAFGLWAACSGSKQYLTQGIEKADSIAVDAHKTLNAPYDSGIVFCRDREALISAMQISGSYIQLSSQRDGMLYTPELSRRARIVELWATLRFLGARGIEDLVDGLCDRATQIADLLSSEGFRILNEVLFTQVLVACGSDDETVATMKNLQESGECWCGGATWNGERVIRVSVCSWATSTSDIERSVAAFVKARDEVIHPGVRQTHRP